MLNVERNYFRGLNCLLKIDLDRHPSFYYLNDTTEMTRVERLVRSTIDVHANFVNELTGINNDAVTSFDLIYYQLFQHYSTDVRRFLFYLRLLLPVGVRQVIKCC